MAKDEEVFGGIGGEEILEEDVAAPQRKRTLHKLDIVSVIFLIAGIVGVSLGTYRFWKSHKLSVEIQKTQQEINHLAYVEQKLKDLKKKEAQVRLMMEKITNLKSNRSFTIDFFNDLQDLIPRGVLISKVSKRGKSIKISGYAPTPELYSQLIEQLNNSGYFVSKIEVTRNKQGTFEIEGTLSLK